MNYFMERVKCATREFGNRKWHKRGWFPSMPDLDSYDRVTVIRYMLPDDVFDRTCLSKGKVAFYNLWHDRIYYVAFVVRDGRVFTWEYNGCRDISPRRSGRPSKGRVKSLKHPNLITVTRPDGSVEKGPHVWRESPEGTSGLNISREYVKEFHASADEWGERGIPVLRVGLAPWARDHDEFGAPVCYPKGEREKWIKIIGFENRGNLSTSLQESEVPGSPLLPPWEISRQPYLGYNHWI